MTISKRRLLQLEMPYAIRTVTIAGVDHVLLSTEGYGPVFLASPPSWQPVRIVNGPGGVMSFSRAVGAGNSVFAIMGCFPGFQFHNAGIYRLTPAKGLTELWSQERVLDLPFAHRLEVVRHDGKDVLLAASLAQTKDSPEDWSRSGAVYACVVASEDTKQKWTLKPIFKNLHKNHGFLVIQEASDPGVLVSGTEGVFRLGITPEAESLWRNDKWLDREVSEIAISDLDADGSDEMVTIEGFHGNSLCVYKPREKRWEEIERFVITSGHGLWAGLIGRFPAFVCGSRGGDMTLKLYLSKRRDGFYFEELVLDENVSPAGVAVINNGTEDLVFVTNQRTNEVALYRLSI